MTVRSGFRTACRFAGSPTRIPSFVKATTDGNIFPPYALPSALGIIRGVPPSMYAASELVVPRSIPMILAICCTSVLDDNDLSGTQDAIVETVALPNDRLHHAVFYLGIGDPLAVILELRLEILQLRQQFLVLAAKVSEFVPRRALVRFTNGGVLRLIFVLQRGRFLVHLRYLS